MATDTEGLWSINEAASFLGMSRSWLYQACAANSFPCVYLGRALRFWPEEVRAYARGERGGNVTRLSLRAA